MLRIQLLGKCVLIYENVYLRGFDRTRLQSLTAYLVLNRRAPQPRSRLAFLLWPDSSETQSHTNLRQLIHQLRKAIPRADDFIRTKGKTIQWRKDAPFELDVADFEQAVSTNDFRRAIDLYQGDLLPECYEDWVLVERERLRRLFIQTLEQLVEQLENGGQYRQAIEYAQRLQRNEPLREDIYCRLMRLYALDGDRRNIVQIYESCVSVLQQELSVTPCAATCQTYKECLRMEPTKRPDTNLLLKNKSNLPIRLTSFIGRTREITEIQHLLKTSRLLTLIGAGGCGKTRLAQQVATESSNIYRDGVRWVELSVVSDPEVVPQAVASALGLGERIDRVLTELISEYLRSHEILLFLDNCEHLIAACAHLVEAILSACPSQHILATSRESLNIGCETVWTVPCLSVPDKSMSKLASNWDAILLAKLTSYDAVRLFVERAIMVLPTFQLNEQNWLAVAQICHHLDGIPLAIELAAGRVKVLSPEQITARLNDRFNLLTGGSRMSLPRYQTLRSAIDWSYELLSDRERVLFRRLAVFWGRFSLEATEAVCADWQTFRELHPSEICSLFSQLVEKSLVIVEDDQSEKRYRLLETIREYALEKLQESGEVECGRIRHLEYYRDLAESVEPRARIAWPSGAVERLEREYTNILAALEWSAANEAHAESALRLVSAVPKTWYIRKEVTLLENGQKMLMIKSELALSNHVLTKALVSLGSFAFFRWDFAEAYKNFERSLKLSREIDYKPGIACALYFLGFLTRESCDLVKSSSCLEECLSICRRLNDPCGIAVTQQDLGYTYYRQGETTRGRTLIENSLTSLRNLGVHLWSGRAMYFLGNIARHEGDLARARSLYVGILNIVKEHHAPPLASLYEVEAFGLLAVAEKQYDKAARLFGAVQRIAKELGTTLTPASMIEHDAYSAEAIDALGEARFNECWEAGQKLTSDQTASLCTND